MADEITPLRTKYAEVLEASDWEVYDKQPTNYTSLNGDAELWRSLRELAPDYISDITDLLNLITDIKNTVECSYVDDPEAGSETFAGRWRQAYIRRIAQGDVTKLVQVLRKGFAESIDWTEARMVEGKDLRTSGAEAEGYRTVRWVGLDPTKVHTMALSLSAVSYEDAVVNGETLSGVWHNISVSPSIADDGSGVVTIQLAKPEFTLTAFQNYQATNAKDITYYFQVPKDLAQAIIDGAKAAGASATASYGKASGLVDIVVAVKGTTKAEKKDKVTAWNFKYKEYTSYYFGLTKAEADVIVLATPAQYNTWDLRKVHNSDGTWDVIVVQRTFIPQAATSTEESKTRKSVELTDTGSTTTFPYSETEIQKWLDLGYIVRVRAVPNESGGWETHASYTQLKNVETTDSQEDAFKKVVSTKNLQNSGVESLPASQTAGSIVSVRNDPTEAGYNTEKRTATSTKQDIASYITGAGDDYSETTEVHKNADSIPAIVASGSNANIPANSTARIRGDINEFKKYDYEKVVRTAKAPSSGSTVTWVTRGETFYVVRLMNSTTGFVNSWWTVHENIRHTITYYATAALAASAMSTNGYHGSYISKAGPFLWMLHKVTKEANTAY